MARKGKIESITETVTDPVEKEFAAPGIEGTKVSEVIRGEDVIRIMREQGKNI